MMTTTQVRSTRQSSKMRTKRHVENAAVYVILIFLSVIWLIPIAWIVLTSFRAGGGSFVPEFFPKEFTFDNYFKLWTDNIYPFRKWFANTFIVAICSCILSTFLTLSISYVLSRLRFKLRKTYMNFALILGMFPGFMSMIAVYYVLKTVGLTQSLVALVLVYSAGAGINFYICKGFFDTIPRSLDEAAKIDGATNSQVFSKIILPLSSPIIVYTSLMAFMAPWADFIFAKIIMGDNYSKYTVAIGMYQMLEKENIFNYFTTFAAGCVCIGVPIVILFSFLQRFYVEGVTGGSVKS